MVRQSHLIAVVGAFLIAVVVVGCGSGPRYIDDERGGEEGAAATNEEITAPKGDRWAAGTAQELVGFDEEVVSPPGQANVPRDFGEGSLWATDFDLDSSAGHVPPKALLKRVDPQTGKVVEEIPLGRCFGGGSGPQVAVGAGSVWVGGMSLNDDEPENNKLSRVDPETNRVAARIPIRADAMSSGVDGVAVGEGAVWVSSAEKLVKVNPETNEVAGMVSVGVYYSQLVVSGGGVWAMGQGANEYCIVQVDPTTMHVVAAEDIGAYWIAPGLAAGGGYVWFESGEGLARVSATRWQEQTTEEARCEGTRTIMMKGEGYITTNDIPGCPNGGLLSGTDKSDALDGLKGEDEIHGLGGEDALYGGEGNDVIYGGPGDDTWLSGDDGDDVIYGGDGNEEMYGVGDDDILYGGDGNDFLNGTGDGGQRDKLYCGEGRDYYFADKNDYVDSCEIKGGRPIF